MKGDVNDMVPTWREGRSADAQQTFDLSSSSSDSHCGPQRTAEIQIQISPSNAHTNTTHRHTHTHTRTMAARMESCFLVFGCVGAEGGVVLQGCILADKA